MKKTMVKKDGPEATAWRLAAEYMELTDGQLECFLCHVNDGTYRWMGIQPARNIERLDLFRPDEPAYAWWLSSREGEPQARLLAAWFLYHMAKDEGK